MKKFLSISLLLLIVLTGCRFFDKEDKQDSTSIDLDALRRDTAAKHSPDSAAMAHSSEMSINAENSIISYANTVLEAMKNKDYQRFSTYIDPNDGVVFSPYAHIENSTLKDNHFSKKEFLSFAESKNKKVWGYADGSGDPINMTMEQYIERFVYNEDFLHVNNIRANKSLFKKSNGIDNSLQVFTNHVFVDYYKKPSKDDNEFDWSNLRLIFNRKEDGKLYLVAVVHHEWQI